ncbi:MAG: sigma-70 family RNA polymerase sigma factor [Clostridia bacterium]|nr:sigma-70 family RNA polymerase sigma factor [Clostridia bacterium]
MNDNAAKAPRDLDEKDRGGISSDAPSREGLVCDNLALVHSCAQRYKGRGIEYEELYGAGCIGLVKAADNFDYGRGLRFSTYAIPVILGEIRRLFRDTGAIKVSRSLKEISMKITRIRQKLSSALGREPTIGELAAETGYDELKIVEALNSMQPLISLTADEDDGGGQNDVAQSGCEESVSDRLALRQVMGLLDENDRRLLTLRYFKGLTQSQTGKILSMTQVRVSRREKAILQKMRSELTK